PAIFMTSAPVPAEYTSTWSWLSTLARRARMFFSSSMTRTLSMAGKDRLPLERPSTTWPQRFSGYALCGPIPPRGHGGGSTMRLNAGVALLVGVLLPAAATAQARLTGADVQGTVRDESGAVLPGVTITTTNLETGLVRTAVTA